MIEKLRARLAERQLDEARAGQWASRLAKERFDSFVRANSATLARVVGGLAIGGMAFWIVLFPLESGARWFALGLYVAGVLVALYHWCILASGASNATIGAAAEQWTSTELKRLRGKGWRTLNHVVFRRGDIDHIAVGPDGVIVVETKWRSDDTNIDEIGWLNSAAAQVRANQKDVAGVLGWGAKKDALNRPGFRRGSGYWVTSFSAGVV